MTREVNYIIEHRKFQSTMDDYATYLQFLAPLFIFILGVTFLIEDGVTPTVLLGALLILLSLPLTWFLLVRIKQLNRFEELKNTKTKEDNFALCLAKLQALNIATIDRDFHNSTISAKYMSTLIPPRYEWLTIVCLDNTILVNTRPDPSIILLWVRRNAMIEFRKTIADDIHDNKK